jgi:uncharacterized membrane protein
MHAELLVLRVVHVVGGIIWVGSGVLMGLFLAPALATLGPTAGQVMGALQKRKMMMFLPIVAILTILSGARLMMLASTAAGGAYFATNAGKMFGAAALAGILAFLVGILFNLPIAKKMAKINQEMASNPANKDALAAEAKALQQRAATMGFVVLTLLLLAAAGMAVARYL